MTPAIAKLRAQLAEINAHAERLPPIIDNASMAAELRKVQAYMNANASRAGASRDRIKEAVFDFVSTGALRDARAARLVCWGITDIVPEGGAILIEDANRFPDLLERVDFYRDDLKPYRRCWRGLLNGYFAYDPIERQAGRHNWELLREYLRANQGVTMGAGFRPDWAVTMADHLNLLTSDPCSRYGRALFEGDEAVLDPLRRDLGLNDSTWLMKALVEAQLADAIGRSDSDFKAVLPKLISFLGKHENLQDTGLARVLNRYHASKNPEPDIALRDHTVARWGNPWLQTNDAKWSKAEPAARAMISSWLKLKFIRTFFSLLSSDQMNDRRRLSFWERYVDEIDDMYFALGTTAEANRSPDFVKARNEMKGRWVSLAGSGANNNAFIMHIRNHVFVEFGETSNALYVFDRQNLPFELNGRSLSAKTERKGLKSPYHVDKMSHTDHSQTWEARCEQLIYQLTGIPPKSGARPSTVQRTAPAPQTRQAIHTPQQSRGKISDTDIFAFLATHRIKYDDLRQKGGSLWVYAPKSESELTTKLRQWNFVWVDRRKAWYWRP